MPMQQAVILSAGKGSRLFPYTENRPKCLIEFCGQTLLEWQLDALQHSGIRKVVIVTGFRADLVERVVSHRRASAMDVDLIFNPFFQVADNLGSVWMARCHWDTDTLLMNGDTLVSNELLAAVLRNAGDATVQRPIIVTVDRKDRYDADDMKVFCDNDRLVCIGKELTEFNAEAIGLIAFRREGARKFIESVEDAMRTPEGVRAWYLRVVDALAHNGIVGNFSIEGHDWQEVDYVSDIDAARAMVAQWVQRGTRSAPELAAVSAGPSA